MRKTNKSKKVTTQEIIMVMKEMVDMFRTGYRLNGKVKDTEALFAISRLQAGIKRLRWIGKRMVWQEYEVSGELYKTLSSLAKAKGKSVWDTAVELIDEQIKLKQVKAA